MRVKIKKDMNNPQTYMVVAILVLFIILVVAEWTKSGKAWDQLVPMLVLLFPIIMIFRPYALTDNFQLVGNGIIDVPMIVAVEVKGNRARIFYTKIVDGALYKRSFYPKDMESFLNKLKEINPKIEVK